MVFYDFVNFWSFSLYLLVKTVLTSNYVFSIILNIFQGVSSEKTFYVQITILPGDIDAKKTRKTFHKLHIIFFNTLLWILHCYEHLWFRTFIKIHLQGVKVKKWHSCNKNHPFLQKSPWTTGFHELKPKLLSVLEGLILYRSGV